MSDLALRLIAENKKSRAPFLDLGNCGLSEIPAEIGELVWLEGLLLASKWQEWDGEKWQIRGSRNSGDKNYPIDLAPLSALTALQTLYLSGTQITDLAPLAGLSALRILNISRTQVADLASLGGLTALQTLYVSNTPVASLAPLASLTALQTLDVSDTQIADLAPLTGLTVLQTLDVVGTQVASLAPLVRFTTLQTLDVADTQVADLAPLTGLTALQALNVRNTQIADLAPLARLTRLQTLDVRNTRIADLTPLAGLTALQALNIRNTQIADLAPLAHLTALLTLNVRNTRIADLAPLAGLSALRALYVSGTQIAELAPLAELTELQTLDISDTQVADLAPLQPLFSRGCAVHWSLRSWEGNGIYIEGCPLVNPPVEIVHQGNDAILNYFREREAGELDHLYEAKMLILGEGGAGKTSLLRRLYQPELPLPGEQETTRGIAIFRHEFTLKNGRRFRLNVWDFGGQEIYHATHQFFLTRRSLYLLLDDTRKDHKSVSDEGFKYWLELIELFGGHSPVLIFQNEKGGRSKAIDLAGIKGKYDNVQQRYAGNLEQRDAADGLREAIEFYASTLSHIGEELPARWIKVRADIEARAAAEPYIAQDEYFDIYHRHMPFDRGKALHLSRYLHDLGVFLHFQDDPLLARTVILRNDWATEAVFRILDDETVKEKRGRFDGADCERLWRDSAYADMHLELLALMQRFELCYLLADSRPQTWLAPQLLPPAKPVALADWSKADDLVLRYRYEFMPKGMISRLTVRLHRFVRDPEMAWATGVLFEQDASAVLVELSASGREIELRARGPEHKALLSVVAADLDALNESFEGLRDKIDKLIPCNCKLCRMATAPEFFAQKKLLRRKEHRRWKVECPNSYEDVDVIELLDGIRIDRLPGWAKEEKPAERSIERTMRIFFASSAELREDRDEFELYLRQLNDELRKKGFYLEIVRWENFLDAMAETRLQDEYNKKVCACDVFVSLFFTQTGKYTEEEFDVAHRQFKDTGKPRIYTYFKNAQMQMEDIGDEVLTLLNFKKKLKNLGHFYTVYKDSEHLKRQFREQLDKLLLSYDY